MLKIYNGGKNASIFLFLLKNFYMFALWKQNNWNYLI